MSSQEIKANEDEPYEFIWRSNGIGLSDLIKDARSDGISIGVENGRINLLMYLETEIEQFIQDGKTLEDFRQVLVSITEGERDQE
jgi:hypothetical protein